MTRLTVDAVKPDVLIWARTSMGLSQQQAAQKLDMPLIQLRLLEEGPEVPTIGQLRKMAEVYRRPLAALFLPEPPADFSVMRDYRLLPGNDRKPYSPNLIREFRRARSQHDVAVDLAELSGDVSSPFTLVLRLDDDPEIAGQAIRSWLRVPDGDSDHPYQPPSLGQWIDLIEDQGILVIQVRGIDIEEMRGCSISDQPFPVVMLNSKDSVRGRVFTLMHELAHILLRSGGICDLQDQRQRNTEEKGRVERYCNQVAAAVLMPQVLVEHDPRVRRFSITNAHSDEQLKDLADAYGVSREAMLLRIVNLGHATWDDYYSKRPYFRRMDDSEERTPGHPGYYRSHIRRMGKRYTGSVVGAYHDRNITGSELADYLDIMVENLPGFELELGR